MMFRLIEGDDPSHAIPPPFPAELPVIVHSVIVGEDPVQEIPPPFVADPLVILNPLSIDSSPSPVSKVTTLPLAPPSMVVFSGPFSD